MKKLFSLLILFVFLVCVGLILYIAMKHSVDLPFSDQIDLFYNYFGEKNIFELFMQQHGPHRQGVGVLIMFPILWISGFDFRSLSYLTIFVISLSTIFFYKSAINL